MTHVAMHRYLWAVCKANGCPPCDWGEAKLLLRVLSALGRVPPPSVVLEDRYDNRAVLSEWLGATSRSIHVN